MRCTDMLAHNAKQIRTRTEIIFNNDLAISKRIHFALCIMRICMMQACISLNSPGLESAQEIDVTSDDFVSDLPSLSGRSLRHA